MEGIHRTWIVEPVIHVFTCSVGIYVTYYFNKVLKVQIIWVVVVLWWCFVVLFWYWHKVPHILGLRLVIQTKMTLNFWSWSSLHLLIADIIDLCFHILIMWCQGLTARPFTCRTSILLTKLHLQPKTVPKERWKRNQFILRLHLNLNVMKTLQNIIIKFHLKYRCSNSITISWIEH